MVKAFKLYGKYNRMSDRYEVDVSELCRSKSLAHVPKEKVLSTIDSLIKDGVVKLIGYNKYSCNSSELENLDADVE